MSPARHRAADAGAAAYPQRLLATAPHGPGLAAHEATWGALPTLTPGQIIDTVQAAGLLGRGGAGFPTARKMRTVAAGAGKGRASVVVANGSEGEPASAKDALLLTRTPHLVLDGIQLAARAVGAPEAYLVVHGGGRLLGAVRSALAERRDAIPVEVREIPSTYVASEETAVVHWLNGGEAKPTFTPPRPFESGVAKRPTLINNVETLAHLATIARRGGDWFRSVGDVDEAGTLLTTLSGGGADRKVAEVPTGTTMGDALGLAGVDVTASSAVLVGGYFGTWMPAALAAQTPLSHRAMRAAGGALGAAVVAALPPDRCGVVETARVSAYLAGNNAGQCGPCLNGLPAIAGVLAALADGRWDERWWPALQRWLAVVPGRGACRHPDGAVRFVTSALQVFASDIAQHRAGRPCAAATTGPWLPVPAQRQLVWR